nr:cardiolipin synthase [Pseudenhygromyxa sp. WMMC2535]
MRLGVELGVVAYVIFAVVTIVLERRRPTATIAWILVLVLMPVVGLVAYLLIGRRKARRSRRSRRRRPLKPTEATAAIANLERSPAWATPVVRGLLKIAMHRANEPVRHADSVEILPYPQQAFLAMEAAIAAAEHRIHIQFYIWRGDETGRRMIALLRERAAAGVEVRLLYDDIGSLATPLAHFAPLEQAGGAVARFGALRLRVARPHGRIDFRNHRKLLCIDGRVGFTGGLNVGDEYRGTTRSGKVWNDLLVRMTGDAVLGLEAVFIEDWLATTGELVELRQGLPGGDAATSMRERPSTPPESSGPLVQIISSGPDQHPTRGDHSASVIAASFLAAIGSATQRIWIVTPYFIPDAPLDTLLQTAAMRGVDVRVLVPSPHENDSRFVGMAARSYYDDLLAAGCKIYEYAPGMLHAKYMVIDETIAVIGSANMDVRSLYLNYEVTAFFFDPRVTTDLAAVFEEDLRAGELVRPEDRAEIGLFARFVEGTARIVSPLL